MSFFDDFKSFVGKYATETESAVTALTAIVDSLPLQRQNKDAILAEIANLSRVSGNIANWLETAKAPTPVQIDAKDIERAVADYLGNDGFYSTVADQVEARLTAKYGHPDKQVSDPVDAAAHGSETTPPKVAGTTENVT